MSNAVKKDETITMRLTPEAKELLRIAANFKGQDLTSYVIGNALEHALKDIKEFKAVENLVLSERDFNQVLEVDPREPSAKMKARVQNFKNNSWKKST